MGAVGGKRILVIDDDRSIREYLRFLLEQAGYEVVEAEDGDVGVEKFKHGTYDLVVTDISMPQKDGIDAIIDMRAIDPKVRIVAMSGVAKSDRLLEIARMYKADRVIKKPFQSPDILKTISELLASDT
jgi:two-component system chemotaxis response regulator CheY